MKKKIFFESVIPLFVGFMIYFFFRPSSIRMNEWLLSFEHAYYVRSPLNELKIADWVCYNLPDAIWIFGLTNFLLIIWKYSVNRGSLIWFLIPITASFTLEFLQFFGLVGGTFDTMDLVSYTIGYVTPFLIHHKSITLKNNNYEVSN